jgi:hypothetical protein
VPQKKLTQHNASTGNPIALILDEKAFFILVLNLEVCFYKSIIQKAPYFVT